MKIISHEEAWAALNAQGVPTEHYAFICPICGTVQSACDFIRAGITGAENLNKYLGFSCIGRFTGAGPHKKSTPPGRGCDWTLGGLFQLHKLEVEKDGGRFPVFEIATPSEAQEHMKYNLSAQAS